MLRNADRALPAGEVGHPCRPARSTHKLRAVHLLPMRRGLVHGRVPVDAITIAPTTEAKVVIDDRCTGCKLCTIACPYGTMFLDLDRHKAFKYNLCNGDPACARACPVDATEWVEAPVADWSHRRCGNANSGSNTAQGSRARWDKLRLFSPIGAEHNGREPTPIQDATNPAIGSRSRIAVDKLPCTGRELSS